MHEKKPNMPHSDTARKSQRCDIRKRSGGGAGAAQQQFLLLLLLLRMNSELWAAQDSTAPFSFLGPGPLLSGTMFQKHHKPRRWFLLHHSSYS